MRPRALPLLLLAPLLVGCAAPLPAEDAPPAAAAATIEFVGCVEHQWFGTAAREPAERHLPAGFALGSFDGVGIVPGWTGVLYECADHVVNGTSAGPVVEALALLFVQPPDALEIQNGTRVGGYALVLAYGSTSPAVASALGAIGIPVIALDSGAVATHETAPGLATGEGGASGGLVVEERVVERGEPAPWEGRFVRAFGVGELREGAAVVGWFDAWVPDRQVVQDAAAQFRLDGLSGPAAEIIEPHAGPALAVGWRNAPGVNYALTLHRVEP